MKPTIKAKQVHIGVGDIALGADRARFERFLDEQGDRLNDLNDGGCDIVWRKAANERPELLRRICQAFTCDDTTRVEHVLKFLLEKDATWVNIGTADIILERARRMNDETEENVWNEAMHQAVRHAIDGQFHDAASNSLEQLLNHLDKFGPRQDDAPAVLLVKAIYVADLSDAAGVTARAEHLLALMMSRACSIETVCQNDEAEWFISPLHLACAYHDEHGDTQVAINALISAGANVERVLAHPRAPTGASLAVIEHHPKVRRDALSSLTVQHTHADAARLDL